MSKKKTRARVEKDLEDWALKQFEKYVKLHKEHEKELTYIG